GGRAITNQTANWTDGNFDWKDIPLAESIGQAAKGQWADWTDGKFDLGTDLNLAPNLLRHIGKSGKAFDQTLENVGWHEAEADPNAGWNPLAARKGNFDVHDIASL